LLKQLAAFSYHGALVDDLAWYIGPVGDVYTGVKLQSAKMSFTCEPSLSFGPTVSICDAVYGGVSVGPAIELGCEIGTLTNSKTSFSRSIFKGIRDIEECMRRGGVSGGVARPFRLRLG
jgi:hypothetical protein